MMYWYGHDMGWWGYAGMGIGMLLVWALLIVGIIALVRFISSDQQSRNASPPPQPQSAEQILGARFARGEISESEYRDRLAVLHDRTGV